MSQPTTPAALSSASATPRAPRRLGPGLRPKAMAFAAAALVFLALDACWLSSMGSRLYRPALGTLMREDFDFGAAALFYLVYLAGLVGFAVAPAARAREALLRGAAFGFVAYATYDLTNQATLRGWPWHITLIDLAWGAFASACAAALSHRAAAR